MKRIISLFLALMLSLCLLVSAYAENPTYDYIIYLLENKEYDMAIHVIEGLRDIAPGTPNTAPTSTEGAEEYIELPPQLIGNDWVFHMDLINHTGSTLVLESLVIIDRLDEQEASRYEFMPKDLGRLPIANLTLMPGEGIGWDDGHPVASHFNQREYHYIFRTEQGQQHTITFSFDMRGMAADSATQPVSDWFFPIILENSANSPWTLQAMDCTNQMDGQNLGTFIFEGEDLHNIGLGGLVLEPGQQLNWNDAHPATTDFNGREYRFHFQDADGQIQVLTFRFENLHEQNKPVDYSADQGKDLKTLRHDVYFEQEVFPGVYWVPAVMLGASRYSNAAIHNLLGASPEEKQQAISTLYEALQLYQVGNFTPSDDNVRILENGINWEHHKPGYHAVRTNTGCCATDSNWLRYILDGDYEEIGFIATSQRDGSGHVYNYILHDGWFYVIDLTHYHASGSPIDTAVENGEMSSYHATDFILGNIHKVSDLQRFVAYVQQTFNDPPGLMFKYTAENVLAVDSARSHEGVQIIYEDAGWQPLEVIFDDPDDQLTFMRAPSPSMLPEWN